MIVIGITGSIGMGKTTVSSLLKVVFRLPVWEADAQVRKLLKAQSIAQQVLEIFPQAQTSKGINRSVIREQAFQNPHKLKLLESILYPILEKERKIFYAHCRQKKIKASAIDVPLLFENKIDQECDITLVVTAPAFIQKQRVLGRPGLTEALMIRIMQQQLPNVVKKRKATLVLQTGLGLRHSFLKLKSFMENLYERSCPRYRNHRFKARRRA